MAMFGLDSSVVSIISIALTLVLLIGSTIYTLRNILKIWNAGKPKPVDEGEESEDDQKMSKGDTLPQHESDDNKQQIHQGGDTHDIAENMNGIDDIDPYEYCEHIQSEVKKAKQRVTAKQLQCELTPEQVQEEREVQRKQLEEIFKLMQTQGDTFGVESMEDVQHQMKLYV